MALPDVVSREQWLEARLALLAEEKKETRRRDALNTQRRILPGAARKPGRNPRAVSAA
jgi:predicted dithiol-disulfide oxidoreductase (DUF899 family)